MAAVATSVRAGAAMPWLLLAAACLGMFAATASGTARAPFLLDMARDLSSSVPTIANLVSLTSVAWGVTSLLGGTCSDRWGRRPFLLGGPALLAVTLVGVATAGDLLGVAIWATLAGGSSGLFTGVIFAEVAARVPERMRGRAMGWVMSGQSLTLLVGVPLAAWVGAHIGWRGVNVCVGAVAAAAAIGLLATTSRRVVVAGQVTPSISMRAVLSPAVLRLLGMGIAERVCYGLAAIYYATFLQATYDLSLAQVALPLAIFAGGNILGTLIGGQLADRLRNRLRTFALAMVAAAVMALALFGWRIGATTSVALGFLYMFCDALARPSLMAALASVPEEVRGTVLGLNGACASVGWIGAAGLGGWVLGHGGFGGFGPLAATLALVSAGLAVLRWRA